MRFRTWVENMGAYWYHETKRDHLWDVVHGGVQPTSFGQSLVGEMGEVMHPDMLEPEELENIPPEDLVPRTYLLDHEPRQMSYGDYLLRFPKSSVTKMGMDNWTREPITYAPVPANVVEILWQGQWVPISHLQNSSPSSQ